MDYKEKFKALRAETMFLAVNKGINVKALQIDFEIPKTWELFPDTKDFWCNVEYPDDANLTGCLYKGFKGSEFIGAHKHPKSVEHLTVINPKGRIKVYTPTWNRELKFGDSCVFKMNEPHFAVFLEDSLINIIWHPKMLRGFELDYVSLKA